MTLEEKVGQMAQITLDVLCKGKDRFSSHEPLMIDPDELNKALVEYKIGSVLNTANNTARTPEIWHSLIKQIQDVAINQTRLKIPVIYGIDAVHGANYTIGSTIFPQQIAQAATRNRELVKKIAEITAYETRASSIPWNFSPVLDLGADPRFSRQYENFGEDPYLASELGKCVVNGYEGDNNDIRHPQKVASCLKHFLGYSAPFSGKDRSPAYISNQALYEYHLPAFRAAMEAGAHSIMVNSGIINGIPVHANFDILTKLLKEELRFKGVVVTDWEDIGNLYNRDHVVSSEKEAIMVAVNAGVDMAMIPYNYESFCNNITALVKEKKVMESRIDDAVKRILYLKFKLGLFETPITNYKDYPKFGSREFASISRQAAEESITVLKNVNSILPLSRQLKILVTGPNANSMRTLNGGWTYSWQGEKTDTLAQNFNTILEAIQNKISPENVKYVPGVSYKMDGLYFEEYKNQFDQAIIDAGKVDVVVLCCGENSYTEKPGDLNDLYLSELQTELAIKLAATGKPIILVLNQGRPRIISKIEPKVPAIINTYLPGNFGGDALADILFGDVNPSGKLPYTYPKFPNSLHTYYYKYAELNKKPDGIYNYGSGDYNPQFEFGDGLSYSNFTYSNIMFDKNTISKNEALTVSVEVTNSGSREGKETIHLYVSDLIATITPDVKRLKAFEKLSLKPGESKTITFRITPEDLAYVNDKNEKIVEAGLFQVKIGELIREFKYE